jgi:hypothetical protein
MRCVVALLVLVLAAWPAAASPHPYPPHLVQIAAGHLTPDMEGAVVITLLDSLTQTVGGLACQDTNADGICGGAGDWSTRFCATWVLRLEDHPYDPALPLLVFVDTPVTGLGPISGCGFGVLGELLHS